MAIKSDKSEKKRNIIATIFLYFIFTVFFGVAALFSWLSYFRQYEIAAIIDKNIIVMATLTEVRLKDGAGVSSGSWTVWYQFTDDDGTSYKGRYCTYNIDRRDEAEAQIGKQVEIYIDGHGTSFPLRERPNFTRYLVIAIVLTILAAGAVAFIIIKEVLLAKDRALLKKIRGS